MDAREKWLTKANPYDREHLTHDAWREGARWFWSDGKVGMGVSAYDARGHAAFWKGYEAAKTAAQAPTGSGF